MLHLVSVHVPKCGGTTLQTALRARYGRNLRLDYPACTDGLRPRHVLRPSAVHGHFPASKYAGSRALLVTFLRDPVEARVSAWHYIRRQGGGRPEWRDAMALDLPDYIASEDRTLQTLLDVPLERFFFVGRMDRFAEDMARFCGWLGVPVPAAENANPKGSAYDIPQAWRDAFARANPREVELYRSAL